MYDYRSSRFVIFATALCLCSTVLADTMPKSLETRYAALVSAMEKADVKAYASFYSSDYVSIDPSGKSTKRAEYLAGVKELLKGAKKVALKAKFTGTKIHKGIADVSFDCVGSITTPQGVVTFHEVGIDTWKKTGDLWMEIKTVDSKMDIKTP